MADIKKLIKCSRCGYTMQEYGKCPRCGAVVRCSTACSGNCLKCSLEAVKSNVEK